MSIKNDWWIRQMAQTTQMIAAASIKGKKV